MGGTGDGVGLYTEGEFWIETFTGKRVNPMHLDEELIDINDIAHSLSLQCRFIGHCAMFYSIAEHCMNIAYIAGKELSNDYAGSSEGYNTTMRAALLHDAAEAYIGDIARPIKHHPIFKYALELEQQIMGKVVRKFNLSGADWQLIKRADDILLATEAKYLMADRGEGWYLPEPALDKMPELPITEDVEPSFLLLFEEYGGKY